MKNRKSKRKQRRQRKTSKKYGGYQPEALYGSYTNTDITNFIETGDLNNLITFIETNNDLNNVDTFINILILALRNAKLNIAIWALEQCRHIEPYYPTYDHYTYIDTTFQYVCSRGYIKEIEWMVNEFPFINIDAAFYIEASNDLGLPVMQFLFNSYLINNIDTTFERACRFKNVNVLLWLRDINPTKYDVVVNEAGKLVRCGIRKKREERLRNLTYPMAAKGLMDKTDAESLVMLGEHFP